MGRGYYDYFNGVGVFSGPAGDRDKGYYSFDYGAWHIIALNSNCDDDASLCSAGGRQDQWLRADLAANPATCTLAFWHHPHFSSGYDHGNGGMMLPIFTTLYNNGVDVALVGHSHDYERFQPQTPSGSLDPSYGITEFVVGTGGAPFTGSSFREPNSAVFNNTTFGVLRMTLRSTSFDWQFMPVAGKTFSDSGSRSCHGAPVATTSVAPLAADTGNGQPLPNVADLPHQAAASRERIARRGGRGS